MTVVLTVFAASMTAAVGLAVLAATGLLLAAGVLKLAQRLDRWCDR